MPNEIILVGASPKTRLVLDFMADEGRLAEVLGVVDRDAGKAGQIYSGLPVLGTLEEVFKVSAYRQAVFCIGLSEHRFAERAQMMERIANDGRRLASIVSRAARIARSASIGDGCIVFPGAIVNSFAHLGRCVTLYTDALVEHDCIVNDNVDISPRVSIAGGCSVGKNTFIGINATILPNCSIGDESVVGAGAVVTENVQSRVIVAGNPARVINRLVASP
jgi:UDP-perosamine 4-acetyltransferase